MTQAANSSFCCGGLRVAKCCVYPISVLDLVGIRQNYASNWSDEQCDKLSPLVWFRTKLKGVLLH